jgi:hypothetical protein
MGVGLDLPGRGECGLELGQTRIRVLIFSAKILSRGMLCCEKTVQQIADLFDVPRSTVYGHLDKTKTVPCQPKKTAATKP